jgi:hypothetical protein
MPGLAAAIKFGAPERDLKVDTDWNAALPTPQDRATIQ